MGTWIMVSDRVLGGLAIALIAGAISSAVFTVFIIPLLYRTMYRNSETPAKGGIE